MLSRTVVAAALSAVAALPLARPGAAARDARQTPDGKILYLKNCRQCHGATGEPSAESKHKYPKIPSLADTAFYTKRSDDSLRVVVEKGKGRDMKGFYPDKLTKEEVGAVVEYMHTLPAKKKR